ncbi:unnamed protein product [Vitrella brassicaformis CCMP3155]|uniref:Uncharacterized protein n=1 Tax=Vitrella brassicaformis (strain CCMP3155) TaxID=1169540 RepID=A0A0G4EL19_VITBC|nr:unnamed protein product [Vitrella brassicaformis CCMP3155]|eukprot:CEL98101.1 unnamed protein product [Vitrella brassicaformis CCMP3155]
MPSLSFLPVRSVWKSLVAALFGMAVITLAEDAGPAEGKERQQPVEKEQPAPLPAFRAANVDFNLIDSTFQECRATGECIPCGDMEGEMAYCKGKEDEMKQKQPVECSVAEGDKDPPLLTLRHFYRSCTPAQDPQEVTRLNPVGPLTLRDGRPAEEKAKTKEKPKAAKADSKPENKAPPADTGSMVGVPVPEEQQPPVQQEVPAPEPAEPESPAKEGSNGQPPAAPRPEAKPELRGRAGGKGKKEKEKAADERGKSFEVQPEEVDELPTVVGFELAMLAAILFSHRCIRLQKKKQDRVRYQRLQNIMST